MQSEVKRPVGNIQTYVPRNTFWAYIKTAIGHNRNLGDKVLWCLGVDWQRTKHKFEDYRPLDKLFHAVLCWEWWAVAQYRFAYWVHKRGFPDLERRCYIIKLMFLQQAVLLRFCYFTGKIIEGLSGARLSGEAEIGPGLLLVHTGSSGIGRGANIGCNFTMHQDANIVAGHDLGYATIGDNVTVYSGARIIGAVHIGDNVRIGANAVVTHDLPSGCLALGSPARPVQAGDHPPPYPASAQMRDFLSTLILSGELEKVGQNRYLDVSTGAIITLDYGVAGEAGQQ